MTVMSEEINFKFNKLSINVGISDWYQRRWFNVYRTHYVRCNRSPVGRNVDYKNIF